MSERRFRVGVLAPMPSELQPVVKQMRLTQQPNGLYRGAVAGTDVVATRTGMGTAQSGFREELKPGEMRHVLVQIMPVNPRFWEETTGFTVYVE